MSYVGLRTNRYVNQSQVNVRIKEKNLTDESKNITVMQ
jgi:hypothetical protein